MTRWLLTLTLVWGILSISGFSQEPTEQEIAQREETFVKQMANCVLIGAFTIDGKKDDEPLKEERYEIDSVVKTAGNLWTFTTRIKYGDKDVKLPVTVPVEWAGSTPVVSLTKMSLPGLGSDFSARVLFYENRYAGTWQHGAVGGHMFGRIEKRSTNETQK